MLLPLVLLPPPLAWALLLLPILRQRGEEGHVFLGGLDVNITSQLLARRLPTMRAGLGGNSSAAAAAPTGNFRLQFSKFRAYGVTKAELIVWLLREGRHVVVSDVDCALPGASIGCNTNPAHKALQTSG